MGLTVTVPATVTKLTTLARIKADFGITDTSADAVLTVMLDHASAAIATHCQRVWGRETVIETLPGTGRRLLFLSRTPLITLTSITEDGVAVTDYTIEDAPKGALARDNGWWPSVTSGWDQIAYSSGYIWPIPAMRWRYAATYQAGFLLPEETPPTPPPTVTALPGGVERAAIETVKAWYASRTGRDPGLIAVAMGTERVQYAAPNAIADVGALPPVALRLLDPWRPGIGGI